MHVVCTIVRACAIKVIAVLELLLTAKALMQSQSSAQRTLRTKRVAAFNSAIRQWHSTEQLGFEAKRWPLDVDISVYIP